MFCTLILIPFSIFTTDIDDCVKNDCQNGATCNDLINTYNCTCAKGFTGTECRTSKSQERRVMNTTAHTLINIREVKCKPIMGDFTWN